MGSTAVASVAHSESKLPWIVALVAVISVTALVLARNGGVAAVQPTAEQTGQDAGRRAMPSAGDIASMPPRERADRLFDRVMRLVSEGKADSVQLFAPMAIAAYSMLDEMDADARYDMGRVAEVAGDAQTARAQADTILLQQPSHLHGLVLGARAATMANDAAGRRAYYQKLVEAERAELAKNLVEYQRHRADIDAALLEAKRDKS